MAYKYLNDDGLKAYTKKVKGALKDLHTPIAISTDNTTESKAQNVRNIADFVAKTKAAGIVDVNGMAVSYIIDNAYSGVGCLSEDSSICGMETDTGLEAPSYFVVDPDGTYSYGSVLVDGLSDQITSSMLTKGARKPIILTPETTEVDEETYQKLLSDDVDVMFNTGNNNYCALTYKYEEDTTCVFCFTALSAEGLSFGDVWLYGYRVYINNTAPHEISIDALSSSTIFNYIKYAGFINKSILSPVLQEIDLTGTDEERKAKLTQFEADWKALTGASDLTGARFVGNYEGELLMMAYSFANGEYEGICYGGTEQMVYRYTLELGGTFHITPLFSHLEPVEIFYNASEAHKNLDNLNAYKANLEQLGVDTTNGFQVPFTMQNSQMRGILCYTSDTNKYIGFEIVSDEDIVYRIEIDGITGEERETSLALYTDVQRVNRLANAVKAFGAIELKTSDNATNKAALTAYKKILTDAGISITNGYSVPVRITGNAQEYHGMLNVGTGALLSGIVTDVTETHHYPFNVSTADGAITFDANNYFLEKTSNEVTEMLDAIKYSYTPVPLTATTSTNKTQLDLFLSKVPNAQVMHVTYKDVYAGTLHKINGSWYGVLVSESNTLAGQLSIKLQADGTIVEGTA